ncbi:MAG: histone deacetylase [Candidatus Sericytochromatia bacterium]|nr:histone deacetylase [Candidatus Sericytochromatia bacterium]
MSVGIITSDIFKKHDTSEATLTGKYNHPESPQRIESIFLHLGNKEIWKKSEHILTRSITMEELYKVHTPEYVNSVKQFCQNGGGRIDEDTVTSPESYATALIAAGSILQGVDAVMTNQLKKVFCLIRPPGHHALPDQTMGFCLFSNLSLGATYAMSKYNVERILVLDWDAHHGNGTEKIFYNNKNVLTISWHQSPFWPFSGKYTDIGEGQGQGYNINIPIPEAFTDEIFIETFDQIVIPAARQFKPQLIMIASGYDAHHSDPLAGLNLTNQAYQFLSKRAMALAEELCEGKIIATLEGGYNLDALVNGVDSTLNFMHHPDANIKNDYEREKDDNKRQIKTLIDSIIKIQPLLK